MPSGRLGIADLSASTNTTIYTVPASVFAVVNINLCNRNATSVTVRIATAATSSPTNAEYIEFGTTIPANGVLERTGIVLSTTNQLVVWASAVGVSATIFGVEA
jgi:hypothetical protein